MVLSNVTLFSSVNLIIELSAHIFTIILNHNPFSSLKLQAVQRFKNIQKLEVASSDLTSTEPIRLPKTLEDLELTYLHFDVSNVFSELNSLKTLCLSEIDITDATLKCIADSCLQLQSLKIYCKC